MMRFRIAIALFFVSALLLFGVTKLPSVRTTKVGAEVIYRPALPLIAGAAMAGLISWLATWLIASAKIGFLRLFALMPALLATLLCAASADAALSRVVIGPQQIVLPMEGFFRDHAAMRYEIAGIIVAPDSDEIHFFLNDGRLIEIPLGDLVEAAREHLMTELDGHGLPVILD